MPSASWWQAFASSPTRRVAADAFVYLKGDDARSVYLVRSGLVKTSVVGRDGRELILHLARAGDVFGETALAAPAHGDHARTLEASEIVEIPVAQLVGDLLRVPGALESFLEAMALRLLETQEAVRRFAFATALERLCLRLLELAPDLGEPDGSATRIPHRLTQEDLGRLTGTRREVVSGLLNRLRDRQLISYTRKGVIRVNRGALAKYAQALARAGTPEM